MFWAWEVWWSTSFAKLLLVIPATSCIPLSYVIREVAEPVNGPIVYNDFMEECVAHHPLEGPRFLANRKRVHQLIRTFTQGEGSYQVRYLPLAACGQPGGNVDCLLHDITANGEAARTAKAKSVRGEIGEDGKMNKLLPYAANKICEDTLCNEINRGTILTVTEKGLHFKTGGTLIVFGSDSLGLMYMGWIQYVVHRFHNKSVNDTLCALLINVLCVVLRTASRVFRMWDVMSFWSRRVVAPGCTKMYHEHDKV
jgi:hypothetical protein